MLSVVCALDDSKWNAKVARLACRLADLLGARLVLVHVRDAQVVPGATAVPLTHERLQEASLARGEEMLARLAADNGLHDAERRVELGVPADRIVEVAAHENAAFVVLGSRGHGTLRAALLGSVSSHVATNAHCPVVVVPPAATSDGGVVDAVVGRAVVAGS